MEDGGQLMRLRRLLAMLLILCCVGPAYAVRGINNERGIIAESNGGLPVNLQDQTTPPLFIKANTVTATTTVASAVAVDDTVINVVSAASISVGDYLGLFNLATNRFYVGTVLSIATNALTMDTPVDSVFEIGDTVGAGETNMAVVGTLASPVIYSIRGADPGIQVTADITRIIITCVDDTTVNLTTFCGIAALTNGLVMRRVDGSQINYVNWKDNLELAGSMYDLNILSSGVGVSAVDGFVGRLTFGGQNKIGVVVRLGPGEELQFLVQDDLSGITSFEIMVEGHVVTD